MMTRVLLIEPPTPENKNKVMRVIGSIGSLKAAVKYPPHDLTVIGGLLRKNGYHFEILDALNLDLGWEDVRTKIDEYMPSFVIFTTTNVTFSNDVIVARISKEVNPEIKTMAVNYLMGTVRYDILKKYPYLDFAGVKDFENPIIGLIKSGFNPSNVPGIFYRENGVTKMNPCIPGCHNFDVIPAHDKLPLDIYFDHVMRRKPMTIVLCSKGCVNQCNHCTTEYLNPLRPRSVDSVIQELHYLAGLGVQEIAFWDSELPFEKNSTDQKWAWEFFNRIEESGLDFSMACNARSDCVNYDILKKMKEVGFHTIKLGADSSSDEILKNMNKNEFVCDTELAAVNIKKLGLKLMTYTTFGHRGETRETMENTIDWVTNVIDSDFTTFSLAVPLFGTPFYKYLKRYRYLLDEEEGDPNALPKFSYIGREKKEGIPDLTNEEMYDIVMKGYRKFYLRPKYIWRRLTTPYNLWFAISNFPYFIRRYVLEPRSY